MMFSYYPLLVFFAPLAAGLITAFFGGMIGRKAYRLGVFAQVVSLAASGQVLYTVVTRGPFLFDFSFFPSVPNGIFQFGLYIDRLSALMMVHISAVSTIIYLFSIRYMQQDRRYTWFLSLLSLTAFVLLCMISSSNLLMLFFFWQILSWLLWFLAHNYAHAATVRGAFRTLVMLRVGDLAFLSGILLAYRLFGTLDFSQLLARASSVRSVIALWPGSGFEVSGATAVTLLIFIGAMSKSAQFPLHMWLPDSLYAPTPVHALLHAGIINAGGFLLNRLAPIYGLSSTTLHLVFAVGALTALLGAGMMLTQNDIKKTLGYSTIGQMGYMIMECGLGAFALAIFHLIAHGLFKATIFLNCGNVIHISRQEPRLPAKDKTADQGGFFLLPWLTGFITTLILPLIILLAAHGVLSLPLRNSQGVVILLFFSWVTSSQAILTIYRLRAAASRKVAALMVLALVLVVMTYLLAAQAFMYFLYPDPGMVSAYFQSAALPGWFFDVIVEVTALAVILNWIVIYARSHGQSLRMPAWINGFETRAYLFFMNRLYMDVLVFSVRRVFLSLARRLDKSRLFPLVGGIIALGVVLPGVAWPVTVPVSGMVLFLVAAFIIPLFPLHGLYVAALTRTPGYFPVFLAVIFPAAGMYFVNRLVPQLPREFLGHAGVLALFGIAYGSLKALVQVSVRHLIAYAGLAFFSFMWWHLAVTGTLTSQAFVFTWAAGLAIAGLLLAWLYLRARYGNLDLTQLGGLAGPMPRFAILLALLVMAAMGLPPFGLFSGYMAMLFQSPGLTWSHLWALLVWLAAAGYLFRMMQRILFGPHRADIFYEDLSAAEAAPLMIVLLILLALGLSPYGFFETDMLRNSDSAVAGFMRWNR